MRIGIIGATGMIGHHTALAAMAAGHQLRIIHRQGSELSRVSDISAEHQLGDLDRPGTLNAAFSDLDCVINAAAYYPSVPRPWREDVRLAMQQTEHFLNACRNAGVARAVYVGGAIALRRDAADSLGDERKLHEQAPPGGNPYVQAKWAMDRAFAAASDERLSVSIAIPAMCFGEFDYGPTTGQLLTRLANRDLPAYVRGNRNVVYAGDAGRGVLRVAEAGGPGQRYLLTGSNTSMDELMGIAAELAHQPMPRAIPLVVARLVAGLQAIKFRLGGPEPVISATAIAVMSAGQHLDGDKARRELGYAPSRDLRETLTTAMDWFRRVGYVK